MSLPERLQRTVDLFRSAPKDIRIQALLDYSQRVTPLPDDIGRDDLEQVHECQTPFFLTTKVEHDSVTMLFDCPPESPTVRGYAGILQDGVNGETPAAVLAIPDDFYFDMGLEEVVTRQRLHGMGAILARLKRQIREATE